MARTAAEPKRGEEECFFLKKRTKKLSFIRGVGGVANEESLFASFSTEKEDSYLPSLIMSAPFSAIAIVVA
jgi:hypothetical protein